MKIRILSTLLAMVGLISLIGCGSSLSDIHVITREDGSGTRNAIVELAGMVDGGNDAITGNAQQQNTTVAVLSSVESNKAAIGYVSFSAPLPAAVRALSIDGVAATVANMESGDYALQRPFNLVNNGEMSGAASDFWNFMFSAQGQSVIAREDYLVHTDNTNAPEFSTTGATGRLTVGGSTSMEPLMMRLITAYEAIPGTNATVEIQGTGSGAGQVQVAAGAYDIGMVSTEVRNTSLTVRVLAIDGIAVIVNSENTVTDISQDDLRAVFMGEISDWDELN